MKLSSASAAKPYLPATPKTQFGLVVHNYEYDSFAANRLSKEAKANDASLSMAAREGLPHLINDPENNFRISFPIYRFPLVMVTGPAGSEQQNISVMVKGSNKARKGSERARAAFFKKIKTVVEAMQDQTQPLKKSFYTIEDPTLAAFNYPHAYRMRLQPITKIKAAFTNYIQEPVKTVLSLPLSFLEWRRVTRQPKEQRGHLI